MSHTPGPWEISKLATPDYAPEFAIYAGPGPKVAIVTHGNSEANAKLIAAAPDLLAALQDLMTPAIERNPNLWHEARTKARAAIAKATGA